MAHQQLYDWLTVTRDRDLSPAVHGRDIEPRKPTALKIWTPSSFVAIRWDPIYYFTACVARWTFEAQSPTCPRVAAKQATQDGTNRAIHDFVECLSDDEAQALMAGQGWLGRLRPGQNFLPRGRAQEAVRNVVQTASQADTDGSFFT